MTGLNDLLRASAALHRHLCPRQVLGVRMGLLAGKELGVDVPRQDKRLVVFMETDGCGADGVSAATGCWVGRRTMRILDFGKVAATVADRQTGVAVRVRPHPDSRAKAVAALPRARSRWHAQLEAYQFLPDHEFLIAERVNLEVDLEAIISRPGVRTMCQVCGEEIINGREVCGVSQVYCRSCAGEAYYSRSPLLPSPSQAKLASVSSS